MTHFNSIQEAAQSSVTKVGDTYPTLANFMEVYPVWEKHPESDRCLLVEYVESAGDAFDVVRIVEVHHLDGEWTEYRGTTWTNEDNIHRAFLGAVASVEEANKRQLQTTVCPSSGYSVIWKDDKSQEVWDAMVMEAAT